MTRKKESLATTKQWAEMKFEPIDAKKLEDIKPVSTEKWNELGKEMLPYVRLAWKLLSKSKAELKQSMTTAGTQDGELGCQLIETFEDMEVFFRRYAEMVTAAKMRCLIVATAIEREAATAA